MTGYSCVLTMLAVMTFNHIIWIFLSHRVFANTLQYTTWQKLGCECRNL